MFGTLESFSPALPATKSGTLAYDTIRTETSIKLLIDIPGIDPDTVNLTVDGRSLRIDATREVELADGETLVSSRHRSGALSRLFHLGEQLDADGLTADAARGVLTVTIPVAESAKPRKISVGSSAEAIEA